MTVCPSCDRTLSHRLAICVCRYTDSELTELVNTCMRGIDAGADLAERLLEAETEIERRKASYVASSHVG